MCGYCPQHRLARQDNPGIDHRGRNVITSIYRFDISLTNGRDVSRTRRPGAPEGGAYARLRAPQAIERDARAAVRRLLRVPIPMPQTTSQSRVGPRGGSRSEAQTQAL